jgi:hypothetical protein
MNKNENNYEAPHMETIEVEAENFMTITASSGSDYDNEDNGLLPGGWNY